MKHKRILILLLTLLMSLVLCPQRSSSSSLPNLVTRRNQTKAMKAWQPFFAALRAAVQKRDRSALSEMMSPEFRYVCCDNPYLENRNEAFKTWDKLPEQGWNALNRLLAQGSANASSAQRSSNNERSVLNMTVPRNASNKHYTGPIADFEWRNDRWWFTSFSTFRK